MSPSHRTTRMLLCTILVGVAACHHRPDAFHDSAAPAANTPRAATAAPAVASATGADAVGGAAGRSDPDDTRTSRIEDLFAGRFPGLDVTRTGDGGMSMRLRGNEPLLLIDGLEADPVALVAIQPRSVLSIEVLRNVSDTAIYGSRGVNGVVRVTTRR